MEHSSERYSLGFAGMRSNLYLLRKTNGDENPAWSSWKNLILYRHVFNQTCHFTSFAAGFRASQQAQCNVSDMSCFDMAEFLLLYCLRFSGDILL